MKKIIINKNTVKFYKELKKDIAKKHKCLNINWQRTITDDFAKNFNGYINWSELLNK